MVNYCAVPGCNSNRGRLSRRTTVFKAPLDLELREQWRNAIGVKKFKECHRVCIKHFQESDIVRWREFFDAAGNSIHKIQLAYPRLKKDALPVLNQEITTENDSDVSQEENVEYDEFINEPSENSNSNHEDQTPVQEKCTSEADITSPKNVPVDGIVNQFQIIPIPASPNKVNDNLKVMPIPTQLIFVGQVGNLRKVDCFPEAQNATMCIIQSNQTHTSEVISNASQLNNDKDHDNDDDGSSQTPESHAEASGVTVAPDQGSSQELPDTYLEFYTEDTPVDVFSQLHLDLNRLVLPQNWYIRSSVEKGYVSLFEVNVKDEAPENDDTSPLVIKKAIYVYKSMNVSCFVLGCKVPDSETIVLPKALGNVDELQQLLKSYDGLALCNGISDTGNVASLQNEFIRTDQLGFMRHKSCELISISKRCAACSRGMKTIVQKNRRILKRKAQANGTDKCDTGYPYTLEEWRKRNAALRVALIRKNKKIESLEKRIGKLYAESE